MTERRGGNGASGGRHGERASKWRDVQWRGKRDGDGDGDGASIESECSTAAMAAMAASSGDFSHDPQHVFWTCSYQMDKSSDMSLKKNTGFLDGLK